MVTRAQQQAYKQSPEGQRALQVKKIIAKFKIAPTALPLKEKLMVRNKPIKLTVTSLEFNRIPVTRVDTPHAQEDVVNMMRDVTFCVFGVTVKGKRNAERFAAFLHDFPKLEEEKADFFVGPFDFARRAFPHFVSHVCQEDGTTEQEVRNLFEEPHW